MGISVMAKGLPERYSIECSYGTFYDFRVALSKAYNEEFGDLYVKWCDDAISDAELERMSYLSNKDLNIFLSECDSFGEFNPEECKKIYDSIRDLKIHIHYEDMLDKWKNAFLYCYKNKVNLTFA